MAACGSGTSRSPSRAVVLERDGIIELREGFNAVSTAQASLQESIAALARRASVETSTRNLADIDSYSSLLPAGTDVFVTWLPGMPYHHAVSVAKRLRHVGMNPVPHVAARMLASREAAADFLGRLRGEAQITRALVISGDAAVPVGPYDSSLSLLETGLLQEHGIRSVGIAGYPEGHPRIPAAKLQDVLDAKISWASRSGSDLFIVSQFCFDGQAILDWLKQLRSRGVSLPVRVGVAGPATVRALIHYGMRCGIGNSLRALGSHGISLTRLLVQHGPEQVVHRIAQSGAGSGIAGLHLFPFGNFAQSARWLEAVRAGRFQLGEPGAGFVLQG